MRWIFFHRIHSVHRISNINLPQSRCCEFLSEMRWISRWIFVRNGWNIFFHRAHRTHCISYKNSPKNIDPGSNKLWDLLRLFPGGGGGGDTNVKDPNCVYIHFLLICDTWEWLNKSFAIIKQTTVQKVKTASSLWISDFVLHSSYQCNCDQHLPQSSPIECSSWWRKAHHPSTQPSRALQSLFGASDTTSTGS